MVCFSVTTAFAADKVKVYFNNEEITKVIEIYSKATGQKFIVDPGVRGKISIYNQDSITTEDFFDQMSNALAINGFAISKQGDVMVVQSARNVQRNMIEVSSEKPSMKPQRMYQWIYKPKNVAVSTINRELRILPSKDGEMNVFEANNQIIFTDWVSNLNRISEILEKIDVPQDAATAKLVQKAREERKKEKASSPTFAPGKAADKE
jgi:general secretion pathway protein D